MPNSMNKVKAMTERAIQENRLMDLLIGKGDYYIPYSEFVPGYMATDYHAVLHDGIYSVYSTNKRVKQLFEETLLKMIEIDAFTYFVAYSYIFAIILKERSGRAAFSMDTVIVQKIGDNFGKYYRELEKGITDTRGYCYKGAMNDIIRWNKLAQEDYHVTLIEET